MKFHPRFWPFVFLLVLFTSCLKQEDPIEYIANTPTPSLSTNAITWTWMEEYLEIEKGLPGFRPAPTCRALAYIHMGGYEVAAPAMEHHRSLTEVIPDFPATHLRYRTTEIDWPVALNAYYARVFKFFLFSADAEDVFSIESLESRQRDALGADLPQGVVLNSEAWGREVANSIIAYAETDREGSNQCRVPRPDDYFPPSGEGLWTPTAPDFGKALFPYWGKVKTFAAHGSDLIAEPPYATYSTDPGSVYYQEEKEVADAVTNLNNESRWIAEFWSDDLAGMTFSPPARIFAIANQLISLQRLDLEQTLHLYCVLGIAINDAAVACWNSKYIYNTERPETYIHKFIDPGFQSILGNAIGQSGLNPSFPGYPSGHSTFAGVSWGIFDQFFGEQYEFTDHCHYGRLEFMGYPRTYTTWKQMAEENAFSRIPLGVHVRMDCVEGLRLGKLMASKALSLNLTK